MAKDFTINERFKKAVAHLNEKMQADGSKGLTVYQIYKDIKINTATLYNILDNKSEISSRVLALFCDYYPINPIWLLTGKGDIEYTDADAGRAILVHSKEKIEDLEKKLQRANAAIDALAFQVKSLKGN